MPVVLVVEDDEYFRSTVKEVLEDKNFKVIEAPNGKVAREILALQKVDAIVSDVQMPHLNGVELLEWLRKESQIPFIMMTGFSHIVEAQTAFKLGANEFLCKPFKNADLYECLNRVLKIQPPP